MFGPIISVEVKTLKPMVFLDIGTKVFHHGSKEINSMTLVERNPSRTNLLQTGIIHHNTIIGVCPEWLYLHIFEERTPLLEKKT